MIKLLKSVIQVFIVSSIIFSIISCKDAAPNTELAINTEIEPVAAKKPISEEFKKYWYAGEAEITSYKLEQARYGELREGNAVLIYVTEPFHNEKQVKADQSNPDNIPVLKLNSTKNYLTGIYPYSIMTSSFYPVHDNQHALKISFSAQEWCGHVYAQLNNKEMFEVTSRSYFESEGDADFNLEKTILENEIWNMIRVNPESLPEGNLQIIPSLEYTRLVHKELKAYKANTALKAEGEFSTYSINYPELSRTLTITFNSNFPHTIESWTDSYKGGFGAEAKIMTSTATKIKTMKSPYWRKNGNEFLPLRDSLGL